MKKIMLLLAGLLLIWSLPAGATLIEIPDTDIDPTRALTSESAYATYINSGDLLGVFQGNDSNQWGGITSWLIDNYAYGEEFQLTEYFKTELEGTAATKSGQWSTSDAIQLYIVKSTDAFALYLLDPLATSGTWSTYDIWVRGLGGEGGIEISHLTGAAPVPEPATMLLFGVGLIGIAGLGRKKLIKK